MSYDKVSCPNEKKNKLFLFGQDSFSLGKHIISFGQDSFSLGQDSFSLRRDSFGQDSFSFGQYVISLERDIKKKIKSMSPPSHRMIMNSSKKLFYTVAGRGHGLLFLYLFPTR